MHPNDIALDTYVGALKVELAGVVRSGDKIAAAAVKAELDRVTAIAETAVVDAPVETAVVDAPVETAVVDASTETAAK